MFILHVVLLLLSCYILMKICDEYFVRSLDKISERFSLSSEAAGATLMAVGSSAPELFVSLISILKPGNHGAMGAGTIVGSAIFNILVIIGGSLLVRKAKVLWQPVVRDMLFYGISIVALLLVFIDGRITLPEASVFIALYVVYVFAVMHWKKLLRYEEVELEELAEDVHTADVKALGAIAKIFDRVLACTFPSMRYYWLVFGISLVWIIVLSWVLVESGVGLAHALGIPEVIIGLTVLAAGTSVPDLISSLVVAKQGRADMAISNAAGSNIFDILICLGLPWLIYIVQTGNAVQVDTSNLLGSIALLFASIICIVFLFVYRRWHLGRRSGLFLLCIYAGYLVWLISGYYLSL